MQDELLQFIQNNFLEDKAARIDADTLLFKEKLIDSLNVLHLIGYIERKLGRRLADEELVMSNFRSVKAIAEAFFKEY